MLVVTLALHRVFEPVNFSSYFSQAFSILNLNTIAPTNIEAIKVAGVEQVVWKSIDSSQTQTRLGPRICLFNSQGCCTAKSNAGGNGFESASSFVIQNCQTCAMWFDVKGMLILSSPQIV